MWFGDLDIDRVIRYTYDFGDGWEHDAMVMWMGLEHASEFDPVAFDIELVNRRLGAPR